MTAVAHEVSRRMSKDYAKERVTEMARDRAMQARDRAVDNPWLVPLIGAGIGALVGRALVSRSQGAREREWDRLGRDYGRRPYYGAPGGLGFREDLGYGTYGESWREDTLAGRVTGTGATPGLGSEGASRGEPAAHGAADLTERASDAVSDVRERVAEKAGEYRERVREGAHALRERTPDSETIGARAREQPGLWALGAMALGALFGFAVPVSERERRALEPARERVREAGEQAVDTVLSKAESAVDEAERRSDAGRQGREPIVPPTTLSPPPDLH
ncbi:hypothetical protein [Anaeromyxobacter sp. Fw109-5]|uniref:hypothetical protein n=1 Tax=Anaeromyxobacter sp. (strain Fw109-5) TaxID=404589 RepID=UPI000158A483|nr:hypothetical protein [Anaeromyxobacter sp. Fw109-5]ABS27250.1 hypothetical protein Anae109_3053 [Anaeromyxobacter sp. Fw109-5]